MKITIVGSGDAFGTEGRSHTCIRIDAAGQTTLVDFGAASLVAWKKFGFLTDDIDAIVVSHLHGDHFGGVPFLLLECQFGARRTKPLTMIGPPGFKERLDIILEALFPGAPRIEWSFPWTVNEILARRATHICGLDLETFEVRHAAGGLATGVRLSDGKTTFAFSGDSAWTPSLIDLAAGADLFLVECFSGDVEVPNHMNWPVLKAQLPNLKAKQIVVTHMNQSALSRIPEMEATGLTIAYDGKTFEF
jgi:ribonuclease BN (tRNA processing enzyme)